MKSGDNHRIDTATAKRLNVNFMTHIFPAIFNRFAVGW